MRLASQTPQWQTLSTLGRGQDGLVWQQMAHRQRSEQKKEGVVTKFKEKVHRPQMEGMVVGLFTSRHESGRFESVCLTTIPWPTLTH